MFVEKSTANKIEDESEDEKDDFSAY